MARLIQPVTQCYISHCIKVSLATHLLLDHKHLDITVHLQWYEASEDARRMWCKMLGTDDYRGFMIYTRPISLGAHIILNDVIRRQDSFCFGYHKNLTWSASSLEQVGRRFQTCEDSWSSSGLRRLWGAVVVFFHHPVRYNNSLDLTSSKFSLLFDACFITSSS